MNSLQIIENQNQRVLLTSQLAESYETTTDTITKNFNRNFDRYQEGKHYYCLQGDDLREFRANGQIDLSPNLNKLYLWTEKGAMLHAKSLNTDKAWEMYDMLVDTYFKVKQQTKPLSALEMLRLQNQVIDELDSRMEMLEEKVDKQITLDHGQQRTLQNIVSKRAYERVGQVFPFDIKENKARFFNGIYKDLKNRFGVASYRDILVGDYANAIGYVQAWIEPAELRKEIA